MVCDVDSVVREVFSGDVFTLCAQDALWAPLSAAAIVCGAVVLGLQKVQSNRGIQDYAPLQEVLNNEPQEADVGSDFSCNALQCLCGICAFVYTALCITSVAVGDPDLVAETLIGDGSHVVAFGAAALILRRRPIWVLLPLWMVLEGALCSLRLGTDISLLVRTSNHYDHVPALAAGRILASVLAILCMCLSLCTRRRAASSAFDPLSVVPEEGLDDGSSDGSQGKVRHVDPEERTSPEEGASAWQWLFIGWLDSLLHAGSSPC